MSGREPNRPPSEGTPQAPRRAAPAPVGRSQSARSLVAPNRLVYEAHVRRALLEDLGVAGDLTTAAVVPEDARASARIVARSGGRIAGLGVAQLSFTLLEERIGFETRLADGVDAAPGQTLAVVSGPARAVLTGERVALNYLGHLCGIATVTRDLVAAVAEHRAAVVCTRKTTPNLRALEKYAVRAGGGHNHRFGLDDAVLIKDNHIRIAGGVAEAIQRARDYVGHMVKIEVEVDTLVQLKQALGHHIDAVLLDNMSVDTLREAVELVDGRVVTEASGGITPETAADVAATGVDLLSVGWLTHSAAALDVALDVDLDAPSPARP